MAKILSVDNLLKMPLVIPNYQRPYKWTTQNIDALLNDISDAINDYQKYNFLISATLLSSHDTTVFLRFS